MRAKKMFSPMQYPHWMILGGGILVVIGAVGILFRRNGDEVQADERAHEVEPKAKGK
jgi:hypothetical protein